MAKEELVEQTLVGLELSAAVAEKFRSLIHASHGKRVVGR